MAATSSPYGFQPISSQGGFVRPLRMPLGIANTYGSNIFKYQPVTLVSGVLQPVTLSTQQIFGVFAGCEFTPLGGRPAESPFWPASTNYDTTYDMFAYIWPSSDPSIRYAVQADGTVAQALMGSQFNISNFGAGSTSTGLGQATVAHAGVAASSQGQFALVEFSPFINDPASSPGTAAGGDAFTDLTVIIAYPQVGGGYQTSIG